MSAKLVCQSQKQFVVTVYFQEAFVSLLILLFPQYLLDSQMDPMMKSSFLESDALNSWCAIVCGPVWVWPWFLYFRLHCPSLLPAYVLYSLGKMSCLYVLWSFLVVICVQILTALRLLSLNCHFSLLGGKKCMYLAPPCHFSSSHMYAYILELHRVAL